MHFLADANFSDYGVIAGMVAVVAAFLKSMHYMVNKFVKYIETRDVQILKESRLNRRALRSVKLALRSNTTQLEEIIKFGCKKERD